MAGRNYKYKCEICNTSFPNGDSLHRHLKSGKCMRGGSLTGYFRRDEVQQRPSYICGGCNQEFPDGSVLELHLAGRECMQDNVKEQITCGVCKMCFESADEVSRHIATCHAQNPVPRERQDMYSCGRCQAEFESGFMLQQHVMANVCSAVSSFACGICQAFFQEAETLNSHMLQHVAERTTAQQHVPTFASPGNRSQNEPEPLGKEQVATYASSTNPPPSVTEVLGKHIAEMQVAPKQVGESQVGQRQVNKKQVKEKQVKEKQVNKKESNKKNTDKKQKDDSKTEKKKRGRKKKDKEDKKQADKKMSKSYTDVDSQAEKTEDNVHGRQKARSNSGDKNKSSTSTALEPVKTSTQSTSNKQLTPEATSEPTNPDKNSSSANSIFQLTNTNTSSSGAPRLGISALCPSCNQPGSITEKGFICTHCRLIFSNFKCEHCSIVFPEMSVLVDHLKNSCKEKVAAPIEVKQETDEDPSYGALPKTGALSKDGIQSPAQSTSKETPQITEKATEDGPNNKKGDQTKKKTADVSSKDNKLTDKFSNDESPVITVGTAKTIQSTVKTSKPSAEQMKACMSKFREYIQSQAKQLNLSPAKKLAQPADNDVSILSDSESEISDSSGFEEIDIDEEDLEELHVHTTVNVRDKSNVSKSNKVGTNTLSQPTKSGTVYVNDKSNASKSNKVETITSPQPTKLGTSVPNLVGCDEVTITKAPNRDKAMEEPAPSSTKTNKAIPSQPKPSAQPHSGTRRTDAQDKSKEQSKKAPMYVMETDEDSSDNESVAKKAAKQGKRVQIGIFEQLKQAGQGDAGKATQPTNTLKQKQPTILSMLQQSEKNQFKQKDGVGFADKNEINQGKSNVNAKAMKPKATKRKRRGRRRKKSEDESEEYSDEDATFRNPKKKPGRPKPSLLDDAGNYDLARKCKTGKRLVEETEESSSSSDDYEDDLVPYKPRKKKARPEMPPKHVETDEDTDNEEAVQRTPKRITRLTKKSKRDDDSDEEEVVRPAPKRIGRQPKNTKKDEDSVSEKETGQSKIKIGKSKISKAGKEPDKEIDTENLTLAKPGKKSISPKKLQKSPAISKTSDRESDTSVSSRKKIETPTKSKQADNKSDDSNSVQKEKKSSPSAVKKNQESGEVSDKSGELKKTAEKNTKTTTVEEIDDESDVEDYVCGECKMYFASLTSLRKHLKTHKEAIEADNDEEKTEKKTMSTNQRLAGVGQSFAPSRQNVPGKQAVVNKLLTATEESDTFVCGICQVQASSVEELSVHMRVHATTYKFVCNVCEQTFPNLPTLQQHSREQHVPQTEEFVCGLCSSTFYSVAGLEAHMIKHSSETSAPSKHVDEEKTALASKPEAESPPVKKIAADSTQVSQGSAYKSKPEEQESELKPAEKDLSTTKKETLDDPKKEKSSVVSLLMKYKPPAALFK